MSLFVFGLLASAASWIAVPAHAQQTAAAASPAELEEIVVTARRREEKLQEVPITITAFTAEDLRKMNINSSRALADIAPSFTEDAVYGRDRGGFDRIRSIPGVRAYFADAPVASSSGAGAYYDLENVQVLSGPQGTLFGINAVGGAILRQPRRPSNELGGHAEVGYGQYNQAILAGALNAPLWNDVIMVRGAFQRERRDGYTLIKSNGLLVDDVDYLAWRVSMTIRPFEGFENYTVWDTRSSDTSGPSRFIQFVNPTGFTAFMGFTVAQQRALGKSVQLGSSYSAAATFEKSHYQTFVNHTTWEATPEITLKNIFSYSTQNAVGSADNYEWDGTTLNVLELYADPVRGYPPQAVLYTEELQAQGNFLDGKVNVTLGGFASYQGYPHPGQNCNGNRVFGGLPTCNTNDSITRAQGLFGQATVNLGVFSEDLEDFNFTAGYRRNWDYTKQKTRATSRTTGACATAANADNRDVFNPLTCFAVLSNSDKAPGWTFNLDYRFDTDKMAYATISRAYSSGGFNSINLPVSLRVYDPQYNTNYEAGIKADWDLTDTGLRTNASFFYDRFNNIQEAVTGQYVDAQGVTRITGVTQNAAAARIVGTEINVQWIIDDFQLTANYVYSDAKYLSYSSRNPSTGAPISLVNNKFEFHADHVASGTLRYNLPFDQAMGEMSVALSGTLSSQETGLDDSTPGRPTPVAPFKRSRLDLRADWVKMYGKPVDLSLALTNVTNHRYSIIGFNLYQTLGIITTQYAEPRMFSARIRYNF